MIFAGWPGNGLSLIVNCQLSLFTTNRPPSSVPIEYTFAPSATVSEKLKYLKLLSGLRSPANTCMFQSPLLPPPFAAGFQAASVARKCGFEFVGDAPRCE